MTDSQWAEFLQGWKVSVPPLLKFYGAVGVLGLVCLAFYDGSRGPHQPVPMIAYVLIPLLVALLGVTLPALGQYQRVKEEVREPYRLPEALGLLGLLALFFLLLFLMGRLVFPSAPLSSLLWPLAGMVWVLLSQTERHNKSLREHVSA